MLPIFHPQANHTSEFAGVVRHQHRVVGACDGGDEKVIWANRFALRKQIGANQCVVLRAQIVEG